LADWQCEFLDFQTIRMNRFPAKAETPREPTLRANAAGGQRDDAVLEIGVFHNGTSNLPAITTKDGITLNDGTLAEVHRPHWSSET